MRQAGAAPMSFATARGLIVDIAIGVGQTEDDEILRVMKFMRFIRLMAWTGTIGG